MTQLFLHPKIQDYFVERDFQAVATDETIRNQIIEDYSGEKLILLRNLKFDLDWDFLRSVSFYQKWKWKKLALSSFEAIPPGKWSEVPEMSEFVADVFAGERQNALAQIGLRGAEEFQIRVDLCLAEFVQRFVAELGDLLFVKVELFASGELIGGEFSQTVTCRQARGTNQKKQQGSSHEIRPVMERRESHSQYIGSVAIGPNDYSIAIFAR